MAAPDKSLRPDNSVKIWSASDFAPIATLSMPNWALSLAFSPDSARVAAGGDVEKVPIWSLPDGKPVDLVDLGYSNIGWLKFLNQEHDRSARSEANFKSFLWTTRNRIRN